MENYTQLNDGYYLIYLDFKENKNKYSYLYKDGIKLSNMIFRKGGLGGSFKDGYIELIVYPKFNEKNENNPKKYNEGYHVIVNLKGELVIIAESPFGDYPRHIKGIIGKYKNFYYNLETGESITVGSVSSSLNTEQFIWVQHDYEWYDEEKKFQLGVYQIDCYTGKVVFFKQKKENKIFKI